MNSNLRHECITYLKVCPKAESGYDFPKALDKFTADWRKKGKNYIAGYNDIYNVDLNVMLRRTLKDFTGREKEIRKFIEESGAEIYLEMVPKIAASSEYPAPIITPDGDIIAFLYESDVKLDIDYYVYS